jgi:hypothetical protein
MFLSDLGPLAQLGERLVRNQEVGGSIPPRSTNAPTGPNKRGRARGSRRENMMRPVDH